MMKRKYIAIEPIVSGERICDSDREVYWADEVDQRIAELEAVITKQAGSYTDILNENIHLVETRVPDGLLEWLFGAATYAGAWGDRYEQTRAIIDKRKESKND